MKLYEFSKSCKLFCLLKKIKIMFLLEFQNIFTSDLMSTLKTT